jgi:hypothetical protein
MLTALQRTVILAVLATLGTASAVTAATPARAATNTAVQVRGTQTPVDEANGLYRMHSAPGRVGLVGDWAFTSYTEVHRSPSLVVAKGTEAFDGCLDTSRDSRCQPTEPTGHLYLDYTLWLRFDPATGAFLEGRCVHPITGGDRGLAGAGGLLTMHDVPIDGSVRTTYRGTLVLAAANANPSAHATSASARASAPPHGC